MSNADASHRIARAAAATLLVQGTEAGLSWADIVISCETAVAIIVSACAELSGSPDPQRFATEIIDVMAERAHGRITAMLRGIPYEG